MSNLNDVIKSLNDFVVSESNKITVRMNDGCRGKTRVDTGYARSRWEIKNFVAKVGDTSLITNDADYIGWLNFGTPYTDGDFMVERTIQEVQRDYR